ncbi:MAG: aminodeoxychorismate synthase component I [Phycisphaerales bacterium]|nr:MAG: aminodeoxychorismate synthase component I [Phycisphaerales bacterium]
MLSDLFEVPPFAEHLFQRAELPCELAEIATGLAHERHVFLLDSAAVDPRLGRYSFLVVRPRFVLRVHRVQGVARVHVEWLDAPERSERFVWRDPFDVIRVALRTMRVERFIPPARGADLPFVGGLIGYLGYELGHFVEEIPETPAGCWDLPDLVLAAADQVVAVDHFAQGAFLSVVGRGHDAAAAHEDAEARLKQLCRLISTAASTTHRESEDSACRDAEDAVWAESLTEQEYLRAVDQIQSHIAAGDLYQMNLTRRIWHPFPGRAEVLYRRLRQTNPAPFGAFFRMPEASVLSCSPERFLRVDADGWVETRPIKGTAPRGGDAAEDARLVRALAGSAKDCAEHVMIVDLLRNDLGRVCEFGTVRVPEVMTIESYATVLQMVSTVVGRLRAGLDVVDLLRAAFPGGSMTGAPKIAAMRLIARLEPVVRGVYSGCLGYLDVRGGCDLSIVIRTAVICGGMVHISSGGAIVADSQPQAEFAEASLKARALVQAVEAALRKSGAPVSVA